MNEVAIDGKGHNVGVKVIDAEGKNFRDGDDDIKLNTLVGSTKDPTHQTIKMDCLK